MGGLFSKPKAPPEVTPPPAPTPPVEEAKFEPGTEKLNEKDKKKIGKKTLQIPQGTTTTATAGTGLGGI